MGLCWSRPEHFHSLDIYMDCLANYALFQGLYWLRERRGTLWDEKPVHDYIENSFESIILIRFNVNHIEMANVSWRDRISTITWWTHSSTESHIGKVSERSFRVLNVIPSFIVHPLPKQFDWWLCSVCSFLWHIQIINENYSLLSKSWTVDTLSLLFHISINDNFSLLSCSLCRETELVVNPIQVVKISLKQIV